MSTPQAMDLYSRVMVGAFDEREIIPGSSFFQAFFGNPESNGSQTIFSPDANNIDIDVIRGNEKLAAMIPRGITSRIIKGQKNTQEQKSTASARSFPLIEEEGDINAAQLVNRLPGENPHFPMSQQDRAMRLGLTIFGEHARRILRLFEYLASQSILTGKMPAILGTTNTDQIYDFRRNANNTITPVVKWDAAGATIMADLDSAVTAGRENGKSKIDMAVFGGDAMDSLMKDTDVLALADVRRFEQVTIAMEGSVPPRYQKFIDAGATLRGKLQTPKGRILWIFTYDQIYEDAAGAFQNYMPLDQVLLCDSQARADRYFGPSEVMPADSAKRQFLLEAFGMQENGIMLPPNVETSGQIFSPAMFHPDAYKGVGDKTYTVRTQAAPIFAPIQTDSFVTLIDVLT